VSELPLDRFTTDKAFYSAIKLHVYGTVHDSFLSTLLDGRSLRLNETLKLEVGRFTARKADNLFVPQNGARPRQSAEFFGFTSHKVREKLTAFHEAGFVELLGKGLRDAYTYKWKLPVKHWEICSFMRFRPLFEGDVSLALETYRTYLEKGFKPFTFRDFHGMYSTAHEAEYGQTRWGKRKFEKISQSTQYERFLKQRLEKLAAQDILVKDKDTYALNEALKDRVNHVDLFMNAIPYHPSRDMCEVCPLDELCQAGSTQKLIVSLNRAPAKPMDPPVKGG
jgi:hypothetical protein